MGRSFDKLLNNFTVARRLLLFRRVRGSLRGGPSAEVRRELVPDLLLPAGLLEVGLEALPEVLPIPPRATLRDEVKAPSRLLIDGFITGMQRVYLFGAAMSGMAAILSLTKRGARYGDQAVDQELLATRDG